jgi:hypothetical protein
MIDMQPLHQQYRVLRNSSFAGGNVHNDLLQC